MPPFIPGLAICRLFFEECVRPILEDAFPGLRYAAAILGSGSEVLGFDTEMSADHHWGPRCMLFLGDDDRERHAEAIREVLSRRLPVSFRGYPTSFTHPDPADSGTQLLQAVECGPVNHRVETFTLRGFFQEYLGLDPEQEIAAADWLTLPQQKLRTLVEGDVFHDDLGLGRLRERLHYYPRDVWLYLLAAGWARIAQEEHLMGRAGFVGDELGSALIGSRLVRGVMSLCFLMERQYAPYPKWFGTAFRKLGCARELVPALRQAQLAGTWQERERHLVAAYESIARMHNALGVTEPIPAEASPFFGRPFRIIHGGRFTDAILARIEDPAVRRIAGRPPIGSIDQFSDSTDLRSNASWRTSLRTLYE